MSKYLPLKSVEEYSWSYIPKDFVVAEAINVASKLAVANLWALCRHLLILRQGPKISVLLLSTVNSIFC